NTDLRPFPTRRSSDLVVISSAESGGADFTARIFNADGSEAGLSGNGTRCAVAYLYHQGLWTRETLRLSTRTGVKLYRLRETLSRSEEHTSELQSRGHL